MSHSPFGWSYPPGCSGPPDDNEGPCDVCGNPIDHCICPECPICGSQGDPQCYVNHGLIRSPEQVAASRQMKALVEAENDNEDNENNENEDTNPLDFLPEAYARFPQC